MRVAVLISGRGSNMTALINAAKTPSYPAEIALSSPTAPMPPACRTHKPPGPRPQSSIIPHTAATANASSARCRRRSIDTQSTNLVCLPFMRLLTTWFVGRWTGGCSMSIRRFAFKGLDTHRRALAAGVKIHGASVHFVGAQADCGPIVAQGAVAVHEDDDAETLRRAGARGRASYLSDGARYGRRGPRTFDRGAMRHRWRRCDPAGLDRSGNRARRVLFARSDGSGSLTGSPDGWPCGRHSQLSLAATEFDDDHAYTFGPAFGLPDSSPFVPRPKCF